MEREKRNAKLFYVCIYAEERRVVHSPMSGGPRRYVGRWSVTGGELRENRSPEAPLRHDDAVQRCIAVKKLQTRGRPGLAFRAHIDPSLGLSRAKKKTTFAPLRPHRGGLQWFLGFGHVSGGLAYVVITSVYFIPPELFSLPISGPLSSRGLPQTLLSGKVLDFSRGNSIGIEIHHGSWGYFYVPFTLTVAPFSAWVPRMYVCKL